MNINIAGKWGWIIISMLCIAPAVLVGCKAITRSLVKNYTDPYHKKVMKAGFEEKSEKIGETTLCYAEGPNHGPALVLLHAQMMDWFDYSRVLPTLSKSYHIFVIDYNGHGKTTAPAHTMNAQTIGNTLATFMEQHIHGPAYVSGNSSGGLLTVWLAANRPDLVKAILLEDPPLFASEYPRVKQTIAYKSFTACHNYLQLNSQEDFLPYWIKANANFIAKHAGKNAAPKLLNMIRSYREANPGKPVELRFLPAMLRMVFRGMSQFDPAFGDAFYNGTWNKDFDHAQALKKIQCPALLLQADFEINDDGILNGAMTQQDADKAISLISNSTYQHIHAQHVVHLDKPGQFIKIMNRFFIGHK